MRWVRDPPCLALQSVDNKVVSMLTTTDNANDRVHVTRKTKTAGVWSTKVVPQPKVLSNYNKYMNAFDRSAHKQCLMQVYEVVENFVFPPHRYCRC